MAKKCNYSDHRTKISKIWHFIAHEDTWESFVVDAILIIIIGKLLLYPAIGLIMGTSYPMVAVVSGSMDHHGLTFDEWWNEHESEYKAFNITKEEFRKFPLSNGFQRGDVLIVVGVREVKIGNPIVFEVPNRSDPIIHRTVIVSDEYFSTKGDANSGRINFENKINFEQMHGKGVIRIPYLGWLKIWLVEVIK